MYGSLSGLEEGVIWTRGLSEKAFSTCSSERLVRISEICPKNVALGLSVNSPALILSKNSGVCLAKIG